MDRRIALRLCASLTLAVCAVALLPAQKLQLPSTPPRQFGASISPAYEGWFDNPDGTHNFLIGYYSRNTEAEIDVPIGPNNRIEPGGPDMGQPTHFLTRRRYGMFVVTMPKEFGKTQRITWTLNVNGVTTTIPFHMHTDYNITPMKSSEESPNREFNTPPTLRFAPDGPMFRGPAATVAKALARTATVGTPMPLDFLVEDDALYSTGGNAPMLNPQPPVNITVSKYRGPGEVTVADARPKFDHSKGGKALEPYAGKASTTVSFSEPGDYIVHVTAGDYSGNGGGGSGCCWTNAMLKVAVTGGTGRTGGL
jgi:hypothetical protein